MSVFEEPSRTVPVAGECDILVAGGGPAGVMAAVAAARRGVRVRLIEAHGALGGIWTTGCLPHVMSSNNNGLFAELIDRLDTNGAGSCRAVHTPTDTAIYCYDYDVETFKVVLERMVAEAGVAVRLYTRVSAVYRDADGRIETVVTDSKSGREAWHAKLFVDCTGDGDLGAQSGCGFDIGQPGTGLCQPMSMIALLAGAGTPDQPPFSIRDRILNKEWLLGELRRGGHEPSYSKPTMFLVRDGCILMMANHEYGYRKPDAQVLTEATMNGRAENLKMVQALRSLGGQWGCLELMAQSAQIGVRESRRIHGLYTVTQEDLVRGARFEDAVCRLSFNVDVHALDPKKSKGVEARAVATQPYDVPLRALIARDAPNLMMAGRCISGDFIAHSSYRISGDAAVLGEAAGIAAAAAIRLGVDPSDVPFADVKSELAPLLA
jgi:hypothetical protein